MGAGYNEDANLGNGGYLNLNSFQYAKISDAHEISSGVRHTLVIKNNGTVWAIGWNEHGQLGLGDSSENFSFRQISIDNVKRIFVGAWNTFIIKNDGSLWGVGNNYTRLLGIGETTENAAYKFSQAKDSSDKALSAVKHVVPLTYYTLVLKEDGTVWVAGSDTTFDSELECLGLTTQKDVFTQVTGLPVIKAIAASESHVLLLGTDGYIYAAGRNLEGQCGVGTTTPKVSSFTKIDPVTNIMAIAAGGGFSMALDIYGNVWVCGMNKDGQLGLGDFENRKSFTKVTNPSNNISAISAGGCHSMLLRSNNEIWTAGNNSYGQLASNDNNKNSNVFIRVYP